MQHPPWLLHETEYEYKINNPLCCIIAMFDPARTFLLLEYVPTSLKCLTAVSKYEKIIHNYLSELTFSHSPRMCQHVGERALNVLFLNPLNCVCIGENSKTSDLELECFFQWATCICT